MTFDLSVWQQAANEKLRDVGQWVDRRKAKDAPYLLYGTLCGLSLWPLVEAVRAGQLLPVIMALGSVAGGVGGNLVAEQVQRWADHADEANEANAAQWAAGHANDPQVRDALDAILAKLDAVAQAQAGLDAADGQWFVQALRDELSRLGNLATYQVSLTGSGAMALDHSIAVSHGVGVGGNVYGGVHIYPDHDELPTAALDARETARRRYLESLSRFCKSLPLAALGGEEGCDEEVTLDSVYIDLDTTTAVPLKDEDEKQRHSGRRLPGIEQEESRRLTALEAVEQCSRLALLGDPGAGKSTFVRKLLAWQAEVHLHDGPPPPGIPVDLLPILIVLRDLAPRLGGLDLDGLPDEDQRRSLATALREQAVEGLARLGAAAFAEGLSGALDSGRCLLVLDGLDEVPYAQRGRVRQVAWAAIRYFNVPRVIVTCRIRSYTGEAVLPGFAAHTLAPFDKDKVRRFAAAWYNAQMELGRVDATEAKYKADKLAGAVISVDLRELSSNPLLVTTMALIHQREIGLPRERVRLHDLAVDVLLRRWQKRKTGELTPSPALTEFLKNDVRLRMAMERLAYESHRVKLGGQEAADLSRGTALTLLDAPEYLGSPGLAAEFLDYADQRAGLLIGRGGEPERPASYAFLHRTFQEYLAGCHMVGQRDIAREFFARAGEGDYWSLAAQLGAEELIYNRRATGINSLLDLAYRLCPATEPEGAQGRWAVLWSGNMAALVGRQGVESDSACPDGGATYLACLVPRLVALLGSDLPATERAEAGRALARLGDPRPEVTSIEAMEFGYVPPGPFWLGSDNDPQTLHYERPQRQVDLPGGCWMARYPTTNAQFAAFVADGGYRESCYWPEAREAQVWAEGRVKGYEDDASRDNAAVYGAPYDLSNHPVVGVTWYEALAFTRWLTERWRQTGRLSAGWVVRLPGEAEWEKAARGGLEVPISPFVRNSVSFAGTAKDVATLTMQPNPLPKRRFPWGEEADLSRASYGETGIGTTSAVGCFPRGESPYGVAEMSGNVWEWCATKWRACYARGREDNHPGGRVSMPRVLRGGAFPSKDRGVRCAFRRGGGPDGRGYSLGFRVVVAPDDSGL